MATVRPTKVHPAIPETSEDLFTRALVARFGDDGQGEPTAIAAEVIYDPDTYGTVWKQGVGEGALTTNLPSGFKTKLAALAASPTATGQELFDLIVEALSSRPLEEV